MKVMGVLTIEIDPKSCDECTTHYRFGRVPSSGLQKGQDTPEAKKTTSETLVGHLEISEQ